MTRCGGGGTLQGDGHGVGTCPRGYVASSVGAARQLYTCAAAVVLAHAPASRRRTLRPAWLATVPLCVSPSSRPHPSVGGRRSRPSRDPAPDVCGLPPPRKCRASLRIVGGGGGAVRTPCLWPSRIVPSTRTSPPVDCSQPCRESRPFVHADLRPPSLLNGTPSDRGATRNHGTPTDKMPRATRLRKKKKENEKRNGGQQANSGGAAQATRLSRAPHADRHETDELYTTHTTNTQGTQDTQQGTRPAATPAGAEQRRGRGEPQRGRAGPAGRGGGVRRRPVGGGARRRRRTARAATDGCRRGRARRRQGRGGGRQGGGGGRSVKALVV